MIPPIPSEAPWTFIEWIATGLSTLVVSAAAFIWRLMSRLERMSVLIIHQRADFEANKQANETSFAKLSERLEQMHDDHYRLRETIGALPGRGDLRDLEDHIGERIEKLAARFDRTLETRGI
jgi:hypothetical protein